MVEFSEMLLPESRMFSTPGQPAIIEPYQFAGTGSESNHKVIKNNLKIVSLVCNIFTIGMCLLLLHNLMKWIKLSKSNAQKRKISLLRWSMGFIVCFFTNTLLLVFVPFVPTAYPICDLFMQIVILITVVVYFKQWEANLQLFIRNRFVLMLTAKSASNRLTFMARVMNLAKGIMKNCDDEPSADKFVTDCQKICDSVYENGGDLDARQISELTDNIQRVMFYKVGKYDHSFCECCCVNDFNRKGPFYADKVYKRHKTFIIWMLVFNACLQLALTVLDMRFINQLYSEMPVQEILDHRNKVDFPLLAVQVACGFFSIYQILIFVRFKQGATRKDDPFLNGHLICIQLFFVTIQRIIFTAFLGPSLDADSDIGSGRVRDPQDAYDILQIARYATMSMEFLFILLPLRHNFVYHNIEL